MSVSIWVSSAKPLHVRAVLPRIRAVMTSLLGLTYEPELVIESSSFTDLRQTDYMEPNTECGFYIHMTGESSVTRVLSYRGREGFVILPQNPNCYPVAAAVAIVLAEHSGSEIVDSQWTYSKEEYLKPGEFFELVRVRGEFAKLNEAVEAFLARKFELTGK